MQGKMASAKIKQTESYLSPLFKQLRKKTTPPDILNFLCRICVCVLNREYIQVSGWDVIHVSGYSLFIH